MQQTKNIFLNALINTKATTNEFLELLGEKTVSERNFLNNMIWSSLGATRLLPARYGANSWR